ncbi:MAG: hypothetical protein WEA04_01300 [Candidatus Andersenbacteria bacterium]
MDVNSCGLTNVSSAVRLIALQFSFSNPDVVPLCVRQLPQETSNDSLKRRSVANGELVINPIENVGLVEFLGELESNGYEMVDGVYQTRVNPKNPRQPYHMVRFVFARREYIQPNKEFGERRPLVRQALRTMCEQAMWRVRAFLNPLFVGDEEVYGESAVSINLEARKPLFDNFGQSLKVWRKDADGKRLGDAPVPLQPDYSLNFAADQIRVQPPQQTASV